MRRSQALDQGGPEPASWLCHPAGDHHDLEFAPWLFRASISALVKEKIKTVGSEVRVGRVLSTISNTQHINGRLAAGTNSLASESAQ